MLLTSSATLVVGARVIRTVASVPAVDAARALPNRRPGPACTCETKSASSAAAAAKHQWRWDGGWGDGEAKEAPNIPHMGTRHVSVYTCFVSTPTNIP
jgi:hypothetical protein